MRKIHVLLLMGVEAVLLCAGVAVASRNSSGSMVAINGPYSAPNVISSAAINARFSDIESEISDSLSRSGKGGMTAPVRGANGTSTAPTYSFTSETTAGLYRNGAGDLRFAFNGADVLDLASTGITIPGATQTLTLSGASTRLGIGAAGSYPLDVSIVAGSTAARFSSTGPFMINDPSIAFNLYRNSGLKYATTNPGLLMSYDVNTGNLTFNTAPSGTADAAATTTERMKVNASGVTIGSSGTAITASIRGTASWTPGTVNAGTCASTSITVTGAASGAECAISQPSIVQNPQLIPYCVAASNACWVNLCNPSASNIAGVSGTYTCRVFNP